MTKMTPQMEMWLNEFGKEYTDRNHNTVEEKKAIHKRLFGITRNDINREFIGDLDRSIKILEVGSNFGIQLLFLQEMGFTELYGLELQRYALEISKSRTKNIQLIQGSIFNIPFRDDYFDLVFTSGVLIHIHPDDIDNALSEIYRCTKKHIWGYECYSDEYEMIPYRGRKDLLWSATFSKLYLNLFPDLLLVNEQKLQHRGNNNVDSMFLLEKQN